MLTGIKTYEITARIQDYPVGQKFEYYFQDDERRNKKAPAMVVGHVNVDAHGLGRIIFILDGEIEDV